MSSTPPTTTKTAAPAFTLEAPEVIHAVPAEAAREAVPLKPELQKQVDDQVLRFIDALASEDLNSEAFRSRLDSAFALGKEEVSNASSLMQGRFMQRNFVGVEDTAAFKAIADIRSQLDELNPGNDGDLMQPRKLLGIIPFGNKLEAYFRKYQSAAEQLKGSMSQLYAARDDMQKDVIDIEATRTTLWEAMQKLAAASRFATVLDTRLEEKVKSLESSDPQRAQALRQEVLFYARQNLQDLQTQQAVCINGYLALDVLKKTGREMINGCTRVATTGMSALAVAQTVARATGNQIRVMEMLQGVNATIGNLISETGRALNQHVDQTTQFAQNPMLGIEKMKEMFDQTFQAMDAMDNFRTKAIEVMGQNNTMIREQLARADNYADRTRQQQAREAAATLPSPSTDGPVKL
ncbi:toxic anion resistance protein [Aquincola sp. S2]|uniref:Toxic anion resistance protein n=1 Tax=Pseudaquabacterium terrae TaxID=2732868 RepID=A0ABX2ER47_9BURK|nr:toxic anion resistance protein [Aquabacterium terrae]NRF70929.1 toxic anion resistance protein [Aquabacterium terrae]